MDFYADLGFGEVVKLFPGRRALISLGVAMAIPVGYWLGLEPRSGLAYKNGIMVMGGVIDADYRDTVYALLHNSGDTTLDITHGMKIIQGVLKPVFEADWFQVDTLPDTARGNGGFGSTGV
jgi:dUTP pyrophosphatase